MDPILNDEQLGVLDSVESGYNIFLTGMPGSGKSFCVKSILSSLIKRKVNFGITAMTGSAAVLINGTTVHSFLGIGLAKGDPHEIINKMLKDKYKRIQSLEVLLVDECSMLSDLLFDKIDEILKIIKGNNKPFGGVQMILVGDGFQLAPIDGNYCFLSKKFVSFKVIQLNINMRQKDDTQFKEILDRIRWGKCNNEDLKVLKSLKNTEFHDYIIPTRLFSRNTEVDTINAGELAKLNENIQVYPIRYSLKVSKNYIDSNKIPLNVSLCIGAQVIITRNISLCEGLVNGTRGIVTGLLPASVIIKTLDGNTTVIDYFVVKDQTLNFSYIPLKLAWAVTIHSSQGMTLDALEIDLGDVFASGQAYTGISRAKSLKTLRVTNVKKESFKTSPLVTSFYQNLQRD
jgi:ATP-dependent DNA helicase PIF1